jgi:hypothetical protein
LLPKLTGRNTFLHSAARFAVPLVTRCDGLPKKLLTIAQIFVRVKPTLRAGSTARAIVSTGHRNADAFFWTHLPNKYQTQISGDFHETG